VRVGSISNASPWTNRSRESFTGGLRDDLLDRELFPSLPESRVVFDDWWIDYNFRSPGGGLSRPNTAAFGAGPDDVASPLMIPAAARGVSPIGVVPLPPTDHADCSATLS